MTAPTPNISSTAAVQCGTLSKREEFVPGVAISGNGRGVWLVIGGRYMKTGMLSMQIEPVRLYDRL